MRHLDEAALEALERGDGEARAYFAQHLAAPCEACEGFLLEHAGPAWLDGMADAMLLPPSDDATLDEVGFRRIQRGMRGAASASASSSASGRGRTYTRRWIVALGSVAAALVAAVGVWRLEGVKQARSPDYSGIKGVAPALTVELQAARQDSEGQLRRVDPGAEVPADGMLVLRTYATERATAWLFKRQDGRTEPLGSFVLEPGAHPLLFESGAAAALPLQGESGQVDLVLVAEPGPRPLTVEEARRAIEDSASPDPDRVESPVTVDHFSVSIAPWR